jgi:hypothetical protein
MKPYRGPPMTLGKRLDAGETQRSVARSYMSARVRFHVLETDAQLAGQGKATLDTLDPTFSCSGGSRGRQESVDECVGARRVAERTLGKSLPPHG